VPVFSKFLNTIVECVEVEGLYAPVIGRLIIFINNAVEYLDLEGASCPSDRRINL
jgi:hypothetical protein